MPHFHETGQAPIFCGNGAMELKIFGSPSNLGTSVWLNKLSYPCDVIYMWTTLVWNSSSQFFLSFCLKWMRNFTWLYVCHFLSWKNVGWNWSRAHTFLLNIWVRSKCRPFAKTKKLNLLFAESGENFHCLRRKPFCGSKSSSLDHQGLNDTFEVQSLHFRNAKPDCRSEIVHSLLPQVKAISIKTTIQLDYNADYRNW